MTARSAEAQRYFDQGLLLYQGFNHEEASRSFERAAELDPRCAMAHWGMAIAAGPNINNPTMDEARSRAAFEASKRALEISSPDPVERDLILAASKRYAWPAPADRKQLDLDYSEAMRRTWRAHPDDADVGALFAESLMDLRPWDQWSPEGEPRPETPEILATLEAVLEKHPDHPLANHAYIHALEASPHPERALAAANRLRAGATGAGHLVHMPSHIDIRLGRYADAVSTNERAIELDRRYAARAGRQGFYSIYRAHNYHFLVYAAMFEGRSALALHAAREMVAELPLDLVRSMPEFLDGFLGTPYHVLVRFGRWEEILREPTPSPGLPVTAAFWRYARGLALSSLGRVEEAAAEREAFEKAFGAVPESSLMGNNPARVVLEIGRAMLEGELEYRRGNTERAFALLREAVKRDDGLHYDEPWGWMQPARHALGALLLEQGRAGEAEEVYRQDLRQHPGNGWSLHGLGECLRRRGEEKEAAQAAARFRESWARADVEIRASCFCRTKV